ncbi:MAG: hypothetical protein AVDCRST_MAG04-1839, partial [uncultured Acetobacteraceae bacterium]
DDGRTPWIRPSLPRRQPDGALRQRRGGVVLDHGGADRPPRRGAHRVRRRPRATALRAGRRGALPRPALPPAPDRPAARAHPPHLGRAAKRAGPARPARARRFAAVAGSDAAVGLAAARQGHRRGSLADAGRRGGRRRLPGRRRV